MRVSHNKTHIALLAQGATTTTDKGGMWGAAAQQQGVLTMRPFQEVSSPKGSRPSAAVLLYGRSWSNNASRQTGVGGDRPSLPTGVGTDRLGLQAGVVDRQRRRSHSTMGGTIEHPAHKISTVANISPSISERMARAKQSSIPGSSGS